MRDCILGVGGRYILFPMEKLVEELKKHSPLSQLEKLEKANNPSGPHSGLGNKRSPAAGSTPPAAKDQSNRKLAPTQDPFGPRQGCERNRQRP